MTERVPSYEPGDREFESLRARHLITGHVVRAARRPLRRDPTTARKLVETVGIWDRITTLTVVNVVSLRRGGRRFNSFEAVLSGEYGESCCGKYAAIALS